MNKKLISYGSLLTPLLAVFILSANAQQELSVHFMDDIWQSASTNPALMNHKKIVVALPSAYGNLYHSGFTFNDAFRQVDNGLSLNLDNAINRLKDDNILQTNLNLDALGVAVRLRDDVQVGLSWSVKGNAFVNYTPETLDLIWNGNAQYIGETVDIAPDFQFMVYNEIGLSGAYNWQNKFTFGAKLKYLTGISDVSTVGDNRLALTTSDDVYQTTFDTDFTFRRAGFDAVSDIAELVNDELSLYDFNNVSGKNSGFGIDLGVTANLIDRLTLSAAIIDLGSINWSNNAHEYTSRGTHTYEGIDLFSFASADSFNTDGLTAEFEQVLDSISQILDIRTGADDSYRTALPTKAYLSGSYQIQDDLTVGALLYIENYRQNTVPGLTLSARKKFGRWFTLGATYALRSQRFDNFGLNALAHLGPVQIYAVSDNVAPLFNPFNSKNFNLRVGLNLAFGRMKANRDGSELN